MEFYLVILLALNIFCQTNSLIVRGTIDSDTVS